jgi:hypothetical protein
MDCKALSLGEPGGAGSGRAGKRDADESGGLVAAGKCRALGGGGGAARPAAGAYARQEAPVRALKTHLRCN